MTTETPMFALEVFTKYGNIRVVGPAALLQAEADTKADTVARLLRILAVDPNEWVGVRIEPHYLAGESVSGELVPEPDVPQQLPPLGEGLDAATDSPAIIETKP